MNNWNGIGNLGRDPELRTTPSGKSILNISIAVDRTYYRTKEDGNSERVSATDWIPIVVWGSQAELQAMYLQKGSKIAVEGELRQRDYVLEDGSKRYTFEIHAKNITWLGRIRSREEVGPAQVVENPENFAA